MITILTGSPGHGKSYTSVKMIDEFVHQGKCVATNVPLRDDFAYQMAMYHTPFGRWRKAKVQRKAEDIESRVLVCRDIQAPNEDGEIETIENALDQIVRVRFHGEGEGRGKVVIDEAHRDMNVRGSTRGKSAEAQKRKAIVNYTSGHRHYGADIVIITQAISNVDVQVRNLHEFHAEVRNFRRVPLLGILARLMPGGQLFLRTTVWNDKNKTKSGVTAYGLSKRLACLYDTHGLAESDLPDNAIMLPRYPSEPIQISDKNSPSDDEQEQILQEQGGVPLPDFTLDSAA